MFQNVIQNGFHSIGCYIIYISSNYCYLYNIRNKIKNKGGIKNDVMTLLTSFFHIFRFIENLYNLLYIPHIYKTF